jgi:topoisomerase-4 subunit A
VLITTSETPEIELEISKGKGKDKKKELINLEDLIDVKGWKALGNKLTQEKVISIRHTEEPEDSGPEAPDEEAEVSEIKADKAESSQGLKKKAEPEHHLDQGEQANLFGEFPKKPAQNEQQNQSQPKQKVKAEQQNLFGEKPPKNESEKETISEKKETIRNPSDDTAFGVGDTIEFDV